MREKRELTPEEERASPDTVFSEDAWTFLNQEKQDVLKNMIANYGNLYGKSAVKKLRWLVTQIEDGKISSKETYPHDGRIQIIKMFFADGIKPSSRNEMLVLQEFFKEMAKTL